LRSPVVEPPDGRLTDIGSGAVRPARLADLITKALLNNGISTTGTSAKAARIDTAGLCLLRRRIAGVRTCRSRSLAINSMPFMSGIL